MKVKILSVLIGLVMTGSVHARGVLLQCWEQGTTQTEETMVLQTDGGYIHNDLIQVPGVINGLHSVHFRDGNEQCIDWDLPIQCMHTGYFKKSGNEYYYEVNLKQNFESNGVQYLFGSLDVSSEDTYQSRNMNVICKRVSM